MPIRVTTQLLNKSLSSEILDEELRYTPTNSSYWSMFIFMDQGGSPVNEEITIEILKLWHEKALVPTDTNQLIFSTAQQISGVHKIYNSTAIDPIALGEAYQLNITSVDALDDVTIRVVVVED